jgi:hypothetical protein
VDLDDLPPLDQPLARLESYRAARRLEEERETVEAIRVRREAGERLSERDWVRLAYSQWGTAARCHAMGFFLG